MKRIIFYILLLLPMFATAEQWRLHPTFDGDIERIIDTPDYTYFLSNSQIYIPNRNDNGKIYRSLFRYEKASEEVVYLNRMNLLSENILQTVEYNPEHEYLMVVYDNGNIDLLYDDGKVVNVPGFMLSGGEYNKEVNGITFFTDANEAYLATDFGFVVVDDSNGEIKRTNVLNKELTSVARFCNKLIAGTKEGLFSSEFRNYVKFEDFEKVPDFEDVKSLTPFGDRLYVLYGDGWNAKLPYITVNGGEIIHNRWVTGMILGIERRKNGLLVSAPEPIWCIDENYDVTLYMRNPADNYNQMGGWAGTEFWMDLKREGLKKIRVSKDISGNTVWEVLSEKIFPNASNAFKVSHAAYHADYGMLIRNHGTTSVFTEYNVNTPDLICSYRNLEWTPRSSTYLAPSDAFLQWNPGGIAIDPNNTSHIYSGSVFHGLMRLDLYDPSKSLRIGREGDVGNGLPGFVAVQRNFSGWQEMCSFSVPAFDNYGNLWTSWYDYDLNKAGQDALEFWYWTPEDRVVSKDASSYRPLKRIKISGASIGMSRQVIPLRSPSYRNILMYYSGSWGGAPVFIDHKGTLDNLNDDERVDIKEFTDQDGLKVEFAYIMSVYEDTANGLVWLGLDNGVLNFRPSEIMKTGGRVNRIKVSRNDGTNLADYLLDGVSVNCIIPDNSGRKWFGTGGGGIVVTSGDGTEVLRTYTTDNSELPDNTVYSICYNPENNSMMISTDKGLAELFLSTSAGGDSDNKALIYPNPVRPDYFGYVTIEGVADNALVKIVDAGGNLIKEVGFAAGGEARWDVTNLNSKRVPGGVYYVLVSGAPDGESFSTAGKVLVVN